MTVDGRRVLLPRVQQLPRARERPAARARPRSPRIERWGCGTGASRLITGHTRAARRRSSAEIAAWKGTEAALLFPSGYQANVGTIAALVGRGDHVFSDALNHASIIDGCRLSRATIHVYPHARRPRRSKRELAATPPGGRRLIVTDSVFSMDGDRAPLAGAGRAGGGLSQLAHGRRGPRGRRARRARRRASPRRTASPTRVTVHMGTLGKALGSAGAYVAGSRALDRAGAEPRARASSSRPASRRRRSPRRGAALDVVAAEPERRAALLAQRRDAARRAPRRSASTPRGDTQIVPVVVGDNAARARARRRRCSSAASSRTPSVRRPCRRARRASA